MKTHLQAMRKRAGFKSARSFAESIGMPVATYTDYEQGRRSFTLERAWEFADVLGCTLDELAGRDFKPEGELITDPFESELIEHYRSVGPNAKAHILDDARGQSALSKNDWSESTSDESEVEKPA